MGPKSQPSLSLEQNMMVIVVGSRLAKVFHLRSIILAARLGGSVAGNHGATMATVRAVKRLLLLLLLWTPAHVDCCWLLNVAVAAALV